jgi:hypothetical protein
MSPRASARRHAAGRGSSPSPLGRLGHPQGGGQDLAGLVAELAGDLPAPVQTGRDVQVLGLLLAGLGELVLGTGPPVGHDPGRVGHAQRRQVGDELVLLGGIGLGRRIREVGHDGLDLALGQHPVPPCRPGNGQVSHTGGNRHRVACGSAGQPAPVTQPGRRRGGPVGDVALVGAEASDRLSQHRIEAAAQREGGGEGVAIGRNVQLVDRLLQVLEHALIVHVFGK